MSVNSIATSSQFAFKTGMTVNEVENTEDMETFNYIDSDGNGVLTDDEFKEAYTLELDDEEYYPGKTLDETSKEGRVNFLRMDADGDKTLSIEEMYIVKDINDQLDELTREVYANGAGALAVADAVGVGMACLGPIGWIVGGILCIGTGVANGITGSNDISDLKEQLIEQYPDYQEYIENY